MRIRLILGALLMVAAFASPTGHSARVGEDISTFAEPSIEKPGMTSSSPSPDTTNSPTQDWGSISGRVTDSDGNGVANLCVLLSSINVEEPWYEDGFFPLLTTDADGHYRSRELGSGTYSIWFAGCNIPTYPGWEVNEYATGGDPYVPVFYGGSPDREHEIPIRVLKGYETANVDASLTLGASIEGYVRGSDGLPVPGVCASVYGLDGESDLVQLAVTGLDGHYLVQGLPGGRSKLRFYDDCTRNRDVAETRHPSYGEEWFEDSSDSAHATALELKLGERVHIDAERPVPPWPDLAVTGLSIEQPIQGSEDWTRNITTTWSNLGEGMFPSSHVRFSLRLWLISPNGAMTKGFHSMYWNEETMEPGDKESRTYSWDGSGDVKDWGVVVVVCYLYSSWDKHLENNIQFLNADGTEPDRLPPPMSQLCADPYASPW